MIITKSELRKISAIERIIKQKFEEKTLPSGIEICEIQLLHLANKIKDTEVDHEIDNYLPAINTVLEGLSKEELIKKMVSVEFNRFLNYYKKTRDISSQSAGSRPESSEDQVRYFVNIGSRDNFDWMSLKDFLRDRLKLGRDDLFKVDVKEGFSFFSTDAKYSDKVMEILNNMQLEGRRINAEISKNDAGTRRDHNGRSGDFKKSGKFDKPFRDKGPKRDGRDSFEAPRRESFTAAKREGSPRRTAGSPERAPRRSESFNDAPRSKRPRKG